MHISNQVRNALIADGWTRHANGTFSKRIEGFASAGSLSDGTRVVRLAMDESGRWLERQDGWGNVERDADLRNYENNPMGAINYTLDDSEAVR